jgi:hypothetical protein
MAARAGLEASSRRTLHSIRPVVVAPGSRLLSAIKSGFVGGREVNPSLAEALASYQVPRPRWS